jgi:hypothetical protein
MIKAKKIPKQCKACKSFWPHGVKDGKSDRWCCQFGMPTFKAIGHCKQMDGFRQKD